MLQRSVMTSRKSVFIFGFSLHAAHAWILVHDLFQPNLKVYLISRQANNLSLRRYRAEMLRSRGAPLSATMVSSSLRWAALTYLGSFLEQGDHHRRVSAAHRPVERTHPAVVYVLYHGPVVDQELDLEGRRHETIHQLSKNCSCELHVSHITTGARFQTQTGSLSEDSTPALGTWQLDSVIPTHFSL